MKAFTQLFLANLREFARDRMALFWTIAFPVLFILIFGLIFSRDNSFSADLGLVVEDQGAAAQSLAQAFKSVDVFEISEGSRQDELAVRDRCQPLAERGFRRRFRLIIGLEDRCLSCLIDEVARRIG